MAASKSPLVPKIRSGGSSQENLQQFDLSYRGKSAGQRVAFRMTTTDKPAGAIYFWVNPAQCQWRVATRTHIEKIQGGVVHHEFASMGIGHQVPQVIDQPVINFSFQSGLISPNGTNDGNNFDDIEDSVPQGLGNFYDFVELLNQPNVTSGGFPNYVLIDYVSLMFPSLHLEGFFTEEGVQWDDSSDNPNHIGNWGASFMVFASQPDITQSEDLKNIWISTILGG